jgi:hypothetical protein
MLKATQPRTLKALRCELSDPEKTSPCNTLTQISNNASTRCRFTCHENNMKDPMSKVWCREQERKIRAKPKKSIMQDDREPDAFS